MSDTLKTKYLTITIVLLQMAFSCSALAYHQQAKLVASDTSADDRFGISVAIDGNIAVVGAYQNDSNGINCGAAYVYELTGPHWIELQKLTASDGLPDDQFGRSVAVEGNTIVVGSYLDDNNELNTGSVYVFTRSGSFWSQQQKLTAPDAAAGDKLGVSVSIGSDTIVAGAYRNDDDRGAAYVFTHNGSTWTFQKKLTASDASSDDFFGYSVAIDANIILIGALKDDYPGNTDAGSVYVYERQGTAWSEQSIMRASDGQSADYFGCSVALDTNYAVIGAYECDINGVSDVGAAYVFAKPETGWLQKQKLFDANNPRAGDDFGRAVAIEGSMIFVGCINHSVAGVRTGAVFEFVRNGETWTQQDLLTASDTDANDQFGLSLAISAPHLIAGAPSSDANGQYSGSAYVFADALPADFDGDFDVDFADYAPLAASWLQNNPLVDIAPPPAGDGIVDIDDLAVFCDYWLVAK